MKLETYVTASIGENKSTGDDNSEADIVKKLLALLLGAYDNPSTTMVAIIEYLPKGSRIWRLHS